MERFIRRGARNEHWQEDSLSKLLQVFCLLISLKFRLMKDRRYSIKCREMVLLLSIIIFIII